MAILKFLNRRHALTTQNKSERCSDDQVLITIMADLQLVQDNESESVLKQSLEMVLEYLMFGYDFFFIGY